jgi:acetyl-CoA carboxylase carboxyl transferase subunit beta
MPRSGKKASFPGLGEGNSLMAQLPRHVESSIGTEAPSRRVQTEAQFRKCDACGETLFVKDLHKALEVCKICGHHFQINALRRIDITLDEGSFVELYAELEAADPLEFKGRRSYLERVREAQRKTGLKDAVVCGDGAIDGQSVVVAVMDFQFIGGSMGSVVGEKITRAIELATALKRPVILICCSGGARMDEGVLSLMQMAKTSAALHRHDQAGQTCITVLTHPTLAGVSASFAFLGDFIIAEPKAMIGFTGARVIEQTIKKKLPEGFQESEFLLAHGQIDMVVPRGQMRETLSKLVSFATDQSVKVPAHPVDVPVLLEHPERHSAAADTASVKKSKTKPKTKAKPKAKVKTQPKSKAKSKVVKRAR